MAKVNYAEWIQEITERVQREHEHLSLVNATVACQYCGAYPGEPCRTLSRYEKTYTHAGRQRAYNDRQK